MTQLATPQQKKSGQLTNDQVNRYRRHLLLPEVGVEGQKKLLNARVLCIGAGGLGCPISLYLAPAGGGDSGLSYLEVVNPLKLPLPVRSRRDILRETVNPTVSGRPPDI